MTYSSMHLTITNLKNTCSVQKQANWDAACVCLTFPSEVHLYVAIASKHTHKRLQITLQGQNAEECAVPGSY